MLRITNVPIENLADQRRLDLVVPGLNVYEGLPLFCDATIVSPLTGTGQARSGTSNRNGRLLEYAEQDNNRTYHEVISSGLGKLLCLGCEVYGRWSSDCIQLVPLLVREFTRGLHFHVRRGAALAFQRRWFGILGVALQVSVAEMVLRDTGADLPITLLEPIVGLALFSSA